MKSLIRASVSTRLIELTSGTTIIYFKLNNATITSLDSGVSTSVGIFAGKAGAPQSAMIIVG